jgi:hypothetical protein
LCPYADDHVNISNSEDNWLNTVYKLSITSIDYDMRISQNEIRVSALRENPPKIIKIVLQLPMAWTAERSDFESLQGQKFSLLHIIQTCSGTHPAS